MKYLEKVFEILKIVSKGPNEGLSVQEVSNTSGLPMSSTHRLLNDMVSCDIIAKNEDTKKYLISPRIIPMVVEISKKVHLESFKNILRELRDSINETVFLSELSESGISAVMVEESNRFFSFRAKRGVYLPLDCTAAGLSIIAFLSDKKTEKLMNSGNTLNQNKNLLDDKFKERLLKIKSEGYAFCNEEYEEGLRALAVPIFNGRGDVFASITAIAPKERISDDMKIKEIVKHLKNAAKKVSELQ